MTGARGWQGTDGSDTALIEAGGRTVLWTNLGEWLELHTMEAGAAEAYALEHGLELEPMHPDRVAQLLGVPMTDEESAGYGDSQDRDDSSTLAASAGTYRGASRWP